MNTPPEPHHRPYWHVDAKWISGILLFFVLAFGLAAFCLSRVTERDTAVTISATIVANLFSKDGLDDEKGLAELRAQVAASPTGEYRPIPQFASIVVTKQDVATLSPRDLRLKIFSQLTGPIYDKGLEGAAADFTANPADQQTFVRQAALLGLLTKDTHETLQRLAWFAAVLALVLVAAVAFFSAGWGRLASIGLIMLLVSLPGALFSLLLMYPPKDGDGPVAALPTSVAQSLGTSFAQGYVTTAITGLVLLLVALVGKITVGLIHSHKKTTKP